MKGKLAVAVALLSLLFAVGMHGQEKTPRVDQRERKQQLRIHQGVKSGELTPKETARLRKEQARIKASEAKAKADGKVTIAERKRLNRQLNKSSKDIYRLKHNARQRGG